MGQRLRWIAAGDYEIRPRCLTHNDGQAILNKFFHSFARANRPTKRMTLLPAKPVAIFNSSEFAARVNRVVLTPSEIRRSTPERLHAPRRARRCNYDRRPSGRSIATTARREPDRKWNLDEIQSMRLHHRLSAEQARQKKHQRRNHRAAAEDHLDLRVPYERHRAPPYRVESERKQTGPRRAKDSVFAGSRVGGVGRNDQY